MSFTEKCRRSEEETSLNRDQRCISRFCVGFGIITLTFGGLTMILLALFNLRQFYLQLIISGGVAVGLGFVILIAWAAAGLCCEHYWCCSCS